MRARLTRSGLGTTVARRFRPALFCGALALAAAQPLDASLAQESIPFESLPSADLIELDAIIERELTRRGVFEAEDARPRATTVLFARHLARVALTLEAQAGVDVGQDAARHRVIAAVGRGGVWPAQVVDLDGVDRVVLVLFTPQFSVRRAGVATAADVAPLLDGDDRLALAPRGGFWDIDGARDVTPIFIEASQDGAEF